MFEVDRSVVTKISCFVSSCLRVRSLQKLRGVEVLRMAIIAAFAIIAFSSLTPHGTANQSSKQSSFWVEAGSGGILPAEANYENPSGRLGFLNASGPVDMKDHAFFEPLGINPRGCVTCHQPSSAMSLSVELLRERWRVTKGEDSVFAAVDGSNNPKLPQALESSHSLILSRGVFRVGLPWPPRSFSGKAIPPEFTIEVVRDPTGVNLDDTYGLNGVNPTVSVFRRPRPSANLKYLVDDNDPQRMILMADARHPNLRAQAFGAYKDHQEGRQGQLSREEFDQIIGFENQVYVGQAFDPWGSSLVDSKSSVSAGPHAIADGRVQRSIDAPRVPSLRLFDAWRTPEAISVDLTQAQRQFRASVARGNDIFVSREFPIRGVAGSDSSTTRSQSRGTCLTCHDAQMTGHHLTPGGMDVGTTSYQIQTDEAARDLKLPVPLFKCVCKDTAPAHPYLGRVIYTTDPGRALITGKCADIASIVIGQIRGLAARAPYFSNGSATNLREVVDFFDHRFDMKLTEQEKQDLVNFLSVL